MNFLANPIIYEIVKRGGEVSKEGKLARRGGERESCGFYVEQHH